MTPSEHFQAGQLDEAIAASNELVKKNPTDIAARSLLCELLCFAGNLDRADLQLDAIGKQDPAAMPGVALFRQLIRAEQSRQQFFAEGRLPEFIDLPTPVMKLHLEASILIREGELGEAAGKLAEAEEQRVKTGGVCGGEPFDDLRDVDDLTAPIAEVLTSNGKYYWIPWERIELIEFQAPQRPRDLLWRQAHLVVQGGPDGEVYLPALYAGTASVTDNPLRLGRATDWVVNDGEPARGLGQRTLLFGESDRTILELTEIEFSDPQGAPESEA